MIHKIPNEDYSWDELIDGHKTYILKLADVLDCKVDYLIFNTEFLKGIVSYNKHTCVRALNASIDRLNQIKG